MALNSIATSVEIPTLAVSRNWLNYVGEAARYITTYIGGRRDRPYLELAWWSLSHGCDLKELDEVGLRERSCMRQDIPIAGGNYAILSYQVLKHLASTLAEGREKYGEWNWLKGFPQWNLISHALDHIWAITNADYSEDHWGHAFCNLMFAIHNKEMRPDLCTGQLDDWFQLTDEIKQTLDRQQKEREANELGGHRVPDGRGGSTTVYPGQIGRAEPSTALGRAVESARGGPSPVQRQGFA